MMGPFNTYGTSNFRKEIIIYKLQMKKSHFVKITVKYKYDKKGGENCCFFIELLLKEFLH